MVRIKNQHTYSLKNCQGGTAVTVHLSDDGNHSIISFRPHYGSNQAWIFQQDDDQNGWFIKSSCTGQYLGIEGKPCNGTRVVAVSSPFKWDLRESYDSFISRVKGIRVLAYGTNFSLNLDRGGSANHTKIQILESSDRASQVWALTKWISIENQHAYSLRNYQGGTAVNLSDDDNYFIHGFRPHDGSNQAWIFQQDDDQDGWFIKSSRTGQYLGIEGKPGNGASVVAVPSPFKWDVRDSDIEGAKGIRILAHGKNLSLDLDGFGDSANRTKIQVWGSWPGLNQIWALTEWDQHAYSFRNRQGGTENQHTDSKILPVTATVREAFIMGDLLTAEKLLTQDINTDSNSHTSYSHRSYIMARQHDWDRALQDAVKSISIQPSLTGYISKGIALCGKGHVQGARAAFDVASMYTDQDSQTIHFLLLIKVMALFGADQHDEANLLLEELTIGCPNADTRACHIVEAYIRVQLGIKALNDAHHDKAAEHFTAAINCSALSLTSDAHDIYEDLVMLFGWSLKLLWLTAHQNRCDAFLRAGKLQDALKSYLYMMDTSDSTNASCIDWSNAFTEECSASFLSDGDAALSANNYDKAIELYSAVIKLDCTSDVVFANRSKAMLGKMLWEDALLDAQKVIEFNPSSYVGYQLSHTALRGAQRYDQAIDAFTTMLSKLEDASEAQIQDLRQQYVHPSQAKDAIQRAVWIELEYAPLRLLNTSTGLLCDRAAQLSTFQTSAKYKELLSFTIKHSDLQTERIKDVVATYFRCVLLSHRWEETEALLQDIQNKVVYELNGLGGTAKLQSFCKVAGDAGYEWAWMDTCCIDKRSNSELQESVNSMFVWYRYSALTIVYLCDVPPSSQPGALARSVWNERGWTFQEFLAPKIVIFYQKDWSPYLGDLSSNHKESPTIMKELEDATDIDVEALVTFHPGMSGAREKLQWASKRITTVQEDVAYSLFGIFGITLPVIYGEKKQNALGRLLQEIVARSGDITVLDWIGQRSEFNSCLPADITSYTAPARIPPSLSEDYIHAQVSLLRQSMPTDLALKIYNQLKQLRAPRFASCRLHLPCIRFRVTEVKWRRDLAQDTPITYNIKADGLHDLVITTEETLVQFSQAKHIRQTFLLVRPWDRYLLAVPDYTEQFPIDKSQMDNFDDKLSGGSPVEEEPGPRALQLMVRLGQPFDVFLLAQQPVGEYKRIASDYNIVAQVKDIASVDHMDVGTVEIL